MHDTETKQKFIELRAKDWSYRRIAEELGVDKNTLVAWNSQFANRIEPLRQLELEALQEELVGSQTERFKALAADYQRYTAELQSRKPENVPQYMLFRIVCRLRDQVERRIVRPQLAAETTPQPPRTEPEN